MRRFDLSYRHSLILVVALLLGAAFVRMSGLAHTPPGIAFDTTYDFADGLRISRGIPFPAVFDTRPEPLHRFFLAAWASLTGLHTFTLLLSSALIGLLTVALTYRAGLTLLAEQSWRRWGALVAAGALAALMPHVFLSRVTYRVILTPLAILVAFILLLRASRSGRGKEWALGGLAAACGMHTYIAGILTPLWVVGFVAHQLIVAKQRLSWRNALYTMLGMLPPAAAWGLLLWFVPGLFFRVDAASSTSSAPLMTRLLNGLGAVPTAWFSRGFNLPLYGTPNEPFLNPVLALFAIVGIGLAVWRWRRAEGALLLGGLLLFCFPAALSLDASHPPRLVGTMPLLALVCGWGAAWVMGRVIALVSIQKSHPPAPSPPAERGTQNRFRGFMDRFLVPLREGDETLLYIRAAPMIAITVLLTLSLAGTHRAYQAMFVDPARYANPNDWLSIPHNYTIAHIEALERLAKVTQPTYVPVSALDTPAAMFVLQRAAYPHVTTWARYGLSELPAGQVFYPMLSYYHTPPPEQDGLQALLLPAEKTIVLLPGKGGAPVISLPKDGGTDIIDEHGWTIARVAPQPARPLNAPILANADAPVIGSGLQLAGTEAPQPQPGTPTATLLYWRVTEPQPADIFTFTQLIGLDWKAYGGSDHHVLPYLYPSAMWQPGDVVPDLHSVATPADLPNGVYHWATGAYVPPGQARLPLVTPHGESFPLDNSWMWGVGRVPLPDLQSALPQEAIPLVVDFDDGISLQGYRLKGENNVWILRLYWRAASQPVGDYTLFIHLMRGEQMVTQQDTQPQEGALPTWAWLPGELVMTTHTLTLPGDALVPDTLYVGLYSFPSLQRLAIQTSDVPVADNRAQIWVK